MRVVKSFCFSNFAIFFSILIAVVFQVTQSCLALYNPMDFSTPCFPVPHHLLVSAQTHAHQVGDAFQPSHPLLYPSPPAFNLPQHQGFSNESVLRIRWPKYWSFSLCPSNEYSGMISFRNELPLWLSW